MDVDMHKCSNHSQVTQHRVNVISISILILCIASFQLKIFIPQVLFRIITLYNKINNTNRFYLKSSKCGLDLHIYIRFILFRHSISKSWKYENIYLLNSKFLISISSVLYPWVSLASYWYFHSYTHRKTVLYSDIHLSYFLETLHEVFIDWITYFLISAILLLSLTSSSCLLVRIHNYVSNYD